MADIKINNMIKFYTLCLLASKPKHGYELMKELEERLGIRISASHVYPFLSILRKNKLIKFDKVGKRDKKSYTLTHKGRNFTNHMFTKFGDLINIAIKPKISICPCGCMIYSGGYTEKVKGKVMKFCCSHCAKMHQPK
ncbi:PadR family transcriptional regulator [Candidatus Woesearchaeota archaeon]|nr:PadR family transcriptional regulator [Candidatus Woesearchaeota archaeon]